MMHVVPRVGQMPSQKLQPAIQLTLVALLIGIALCVAAYELVQGAEIGSKTNIALGILIGILPALLYFAIEKPFIFPFGLFVLLAPVDPLLGLSSHVGTLTKLVALAAGLAFIFWMIRHRCYIKPDKVIFVWLGLLIWMGLSVFWAINQVAASTTLITYSLLIALYVVTSLMPVSDQQYKGFLYAVVLSGIAGAAGSVYLYHSGIFVHNEMPNGILSQRFVLKYGDTGLNPDFFAAALLLPTAVILTWALARPWSLSKLGLMGIFAVMVGGIIVNGSRATFLALPVMLGYMIARGRHKGQLIVMSVLALIASMAMPHSPWARFTTAFRSGGSGRLDIWKVGLEAFKHHWLFGAGVGNFPAAYNQSFIGIYQALYAEWSRAPHNAILEFAVELGVVGLFLFLSAWYLQARSLRLISPRSSLFDMRIALEATILALFVNAIFLGVMEFKTTWILFSLIMVTRSAALTTAEQEAQKSEPAYIGLQRRNGRQSRLEEPVNAR